MEMQEEMKYEILTTDLEGVLVAKKDFNLGKHQDIDTKNLYVCIPLSRHP
jgi:hypothetical protein